MDYLNNKSILFELEEYKNVDNTKKLSKPKHSDNNGSKEANRETIESNVEDEK